MILSVLFLLLHVFAVVLCQRHVTRINTKPSKFARYNQMVRFMPFLPKSKTEPTYVVTS